MRIIGAFSELMLAKGSWRVICHGKPASTAGSGQQMDSREPLARIQSGLYPSLIDQDKAPVRLPI